MYTLFGLVLREAGGFPTHFRGGGLNKERRAQQKERRLRRYRRRPREGTYQTHRVIELQNVTAPRDFLVI